MSKTARTVLRVVQALPAKWPGRVVFRAYTRLESSDAVALTFDDGPDSGLETLLDLLEGAGARATFFAVGEQVERDPGKLREMISRGHEVAAHCYHHRKYLRLTPDQVVEDMRRARSVIEEATETPVRLFRPPHGVFTLASWLETGRQGLERVLWTRDSRDWDARATPQSVLDNVGLPTAGDIVLLHDSDRYSTPGCWENTRRALPIILGRTSQLGLRARSVGEILSNKKR